QQQDRQHIGGQDRHGTPGGGVPPFRMPPAGFASAHQIVLTSGSAGPLHNASGSNGGSPMRVALAALLMLTATPVLAAEIGCDGVFNASTTLADIEAAYGKDNVVTGEVPGPEGMT